MVNKTLPLPILKYVEISATQLDAIIAEYPFYLLPRVARALNQNKNEGKTIADLNYFGFESKIFEAYAKTFNSPDYNSKKESESENSDTKRINSNNELTPSLNDIIIEIYDNKSDKNDVEENIISEENKAKEPIETSIEVKSFVQNTALENESTKITTPSLTALISQLEIKNDEKLVIENEISPELINNLSAEVKEESFREETEVSTSNVQNESEISYLEITPSKLVNVKNSDTNIIEIDAVQFDPEFLNTDEEMIHFVNESENQSEMLDNLKEKITKSTTEEAIELIESEENESKSIDDNNLQYVFLDNIIEFTNIDVEAHIPPVESKIEQIEPIIETKTAETVININPIEEIENTVFQSLAENIDNEEIEDSNNLDFNSWLNHFGHLTKPNLNLTQPKLETKRDEVDENLAISHIEHTILDEIEPKVDHETKLNLAKDDELEGVLKDSFYLKQIETKKESKLTPVTNRIQDDAHQSLIGIDIISETIAVLYGQQGNSTKAIEVYEKLIKKFPEKSSFFATQIENLKK